LFVVSSTNVDPIFKILLQANSFTPTLNATMHSVTDGRTGQTDILCSLYSSTIGKNGLILIKLWNYETCCWNSP